MSWLKKLASLLMFQNSDECTCADTLEFDIAVDQKICPCQVIREHQELPQQKPVMNVLTPERTHLA